MVANRKDQAKRVVLFLKGRCYRYFISLIPLNSMGQFHSFFSVSVFSPINAEFCRMLLASEASMLAVLIGFTENGGERSLKYI